MPRSKKRKSSINNLSNARSSRHSNASDSKEEHVEASSFSFMKNEGGRPKKKKKVSLVRARSILWDNEIPHYAKNELEKTHARLASMRRCRSKFGAGSLKFWFFLYLFMSIIGFQLFDGLSRYEAIQKVAKHQRTSASRLAPKYDFFMKTKQVMVPC